LAERGGEESVEEVLKNPKFVLFNLLRVLKFFYSFKELEKLLGVSSQVLWRYVSLRVMPEKETAQKLLAKIREKRLVEEAVRRAVEASREPWMLFSNPGVLELAALKAVDEFRKTRIDAVLAAPDPYSSSLAAITALYLRSRLCTASKTPLSSSILAEVYEVQPGIIEVAATPRECVQRRSKILVVAAAAPPIQGLTAALGVTLRGHADVVGILVLEGWEEAVNEAIKTAHLAANPKTIILVTREKPVEQGKQADTGRRRSTKSNNQ
jgi:hypothetical protein